MRGILLYLYKNEIGYAQKVSKELGFCWSDACRRFKVLVDEGLIEFVENKGKKCYPFLPTNRKNKYHKITEKGKRVAKLIILLNEELKKR